MPAPLSAHLRSRSGRGVLAAPEQLVQVVGLRLVELRGPGAHIIHRRQRLFTAGRSLITPTQRMTFGYFSAASAPSSTGILRAHG